MSNEYNKMLQLTNNGIEYQNTDEILNDVKSAFTKAFPNLNVDSVDTPQGQIIAFITEKLSEARDSVLQFTNATFLGGYRAYEDINANTFFGITRHGASNATVKVKVSGQPKTIIPANFRAKSGSYEFINSSGETTINDSGFATIEMSCVEFGEIQILKNTLNTILTPVYGIESINNDEDSTKGSNEENNLWIRALESQSFRAVALFESYLSKIMNVSGVTDVVGYDNYTSKTVVHKNQSFTPHTIGIVVEGGEIKDIAEAMYKARNPGPAMIGDIEYEVLGNFDNQSYIMRFSRPIYTKLRCKIEVCLGKLADQNYEYNLKNQIVDIIKRNKINQTIFSDSKKLQIVKPNDVDIVYIKFEKLTNENQALEIQGEDIIELDFKEKATISLSDIEVSVYNGLRI